jgi:seryl-tRNA synthetase
MPPPRPSPHKSPPPDPRPVSTTLPPPRQTGKIKTAHPFSEKTNMDKKAKKRLEVLRQRTQKLQQQIAGAKKQTDEPGEIERLENELNEVKTEIEKLKSS